VATNGNEMDVVEPDWLEMERWKIDALGSKFEAVVDKAMHTKLGCPPAKREDVRLSLYRAVHHFEMQRWIDQEYGGANTTKWLKGVETAATALAKLLEAALSPVPSVTVELASDTLRQLYGGKALLHLEDEVRRLATVTRQHLAEVTEALRAERRRGRRPDKLPRKLAEELVEILTEHAGRRPGISRRGPMVRLVKAVLDFLGEEERKDATIYDWMLKKQ
jgi:AcrR family transcriptional regulator